LKNKRKPKPNYAVLQWKIYLKIALIAFAALIIVAVLSYLTNHRAANWIVSFFQKTFAMDFDSARSLYQRVIRNNIDYIIYATFGIFFIILARFLLSQFAKYFNEISDGLDMLVENKDGEIKLSPEMTSMEQKLKTIKQTLEQREQEVKSSEQRKNDVVMYLAHDIKTPLTSVIGYLSLLDESPDMPPEQKAKYVNITLEKANRLERLVDEFFEITRYSFQASEALSKKRIDLYYMLLQMTDEFYPLLASNGKEAALNVPEDFIIYGDPDKLARVFNNILKNAVAYGADNSIINITAIASGDMVSIVFTNEGSVPKDKLAAIFDKFYRLDSARPSDTGGTGLGLAIAKEIVISHGGKIYADSDGKNTVFTVELPVTI
jgi:two-component system sensor histidine kinase VanS